MIEGAGHGIEAGGIDDHIQIMVRCCRLDARFRDPPDWAFADIDKMHIIAVVGFEITGFKGDALDPEAMILRDQLVRRHRILHPFADTPRNIV